MKIKVIWKDKDNTVFDLQVYEIKVSEEHITLFEEKHRFWTVLKLSEIKEYIMEK